MFLDYIHKFIQMINSFTGAAPSPAPAPSETSFQSVETEQNDVDPTDDESMDDEDVEAEE